MTQHSGQDWAYKGHRDWQDEDQVCRGVSRAGCVKAPTGELPPDRVEGDRTQRDRQQPNTPSTQKG